MFKIFSNPAALVSALFSVCLLATLSSCGGGRGTAGTITDTKANVWRIGFYNLENLFDTEDNPRTKDDDFLPTGKLQWTAERYQKKIKNLSEVLSIIQPTMMGFCEVENRKVVQDLMNGTPTLISSDYDIVHYESPDERGSDCAFVYQRSAFKVLNSRPIRVVIPSVEKKANTPQATRDILQIDGILGGRDTLSVFVNHWPSRRIGDKNSEPRRIAAAKTLRRAVDSLGKARPTSKMIIMGDFNDQPTDVSISEALRAREDRNNVSNGDLFNLLADLHLLDRGSYFYKGIWNMLDQVIVTPNLLSDKKGDLQAGNPQIFQEDWVMFKHKDYGLLPNRTYGGLKYYGGYSDHLPVYIDLTRR
jgi:predicted extracellular nuclease